MQGNLHVPFLGGWAGAIPPGYPAGESNLASLSRRLCSSVKTCYRRRISLVVSELMPRPLEVLLNADLLACTPAVQYRTCQTYIHDLRWKDRPLQCPRCHSYDVNPWGTYHYRPGC